MSSLVIYLSQGVYTDFTLIRFYFLHLSESPWSERALCQTCVNVLISPHVVWCPCRFSLIFSMQLYHGKRPFDCPVAGNAPLSRVLYPLPFQFLTTFLGCRSFKVIFCNQELSRKSGCQVLQTNATTLGHAESLTPIFDLTLLGEFDSTVSFSIY